MLRAACCEDLPQILEIYAPYVEQTTVSFEYTVPSAEEFAERFKSVTAQFPWLVWEENGKILGYAYGSAPFGRAAYRWCAEGSVYLRMDERGRGIGTRLYTALEELLALQGYRLIYAIVTSENEASLAFHYRNGYSLRAEFPECAWKFGRNLGVRWLEKRLASGEAPENFPAPWPEIRQNKQKISEILSRNTIS